MIDWQSVLFNSIWILGASLALAVLSITYFKAQSESESVRNTLSDSGLTLALKIAGIIFCLGIAMTSHSWWEITLWIILVIGFGYQIFLLLSKS
jgi:mannose/fructose/N-acetylgalactosamine-specific phosphotransferase system component IIC